MNHTLDHVSIGRFMEFANPEPMEDQKLLVHHATIMGYERLYQPAEMARSIYTMKHECVLIRGPFNWTKDGQSLANAHTHLNLEQVCELHGWKIVERYGNHFAIVAPV